MSEANPGDSPARGRQGEARTNDRRILDAARMVLTEDPRASMAAVANRAGVGVASLYRRFASKQELLEQLCLDAMNAITAVTVEALDRLDASDPWPAYVEYLSAALEAGGGSLTPLAGTFRPGAQVNAAAERMHEASARLLARVQQAGVVRDDITAQDVTQLLEMVYAVYLGDADRRAALRRRYLNLFAPALRAPIVLALPELPPSAQEVIDAWNPAAGKGNTDRRPG